MLAISSHTNTKHGNEEATAAGMGTCWTQQRGLLRPKADLATTPFARPTCQRRETAPSQQYDTVPDGAQPAPAWQRDNIGPVWCAQNPEDTSSGFWV